METGEPAGAKKSVRAMQVLCIALVAGVVLFALIIVGLNMTSGPALKEKDVAFGNILLYVVAGVAIVCALVSRKLYNKGLAGLVDSKESLAERLNQYRAVLILYMAPCEGAALFAIIALFLTGNYYFLVIAAVMLMLMFNKLPWKAKLIDELKLEWQDQQELN